MSDISSFTGEHDFLSNSYLSSFVYKGTLYRSVAHAYNALKTDDQVLASKIRSCESPSEATKLGRTVKVRSTWSAENRHVMLELLVQKFKNPFLREKLIATGVAKITTRGTFTGDLLMEVREIAKSELLKEQELFGIRSRSPFE